jgi:hypothetical protein
MRGNFGQQVHVPARDLEPDRIDETVCCCSRAVVRLSRLAQKREGARISPAGICR